MMYFWDGTGHWWMWLIMVVFWIAVILLVVWAVKAITSKTSETSSQGLKALDIARERYARGEITKEQFEQIRKDLS